MREILQNSINKKLLLCVLALILLFLFLLLKKVSFLDENKQDHRKISLAIDFDKNESKVAIVLGVVGSLKLENLIDLQKEITIGIPLYMKIDDDKKLFGYNIALNLDAETLNKKENSLEFLDGILNSNIPYQAAYINNDRLFNSSNTIIEHLFKSLRDKEIIFLATTNENSSFYKITSDLNYPILRNNIFLDEKLSSECIMQNLVDLEKIAHETGFAIAIGSTYPLTIKTIKEWVSTLSNKGIKLVSIKDLYKEFQSN